MSDQQQQVPPVDDTDAMRDDDVAEQADGSADVANVTTDTATDTATAAPANPSEDAYNSPGMDEGMIALDGSDPNVQIVDDGSSGNLPDGMMLVSTPDVAAMRKLEDEQGMVDAPNDDDDEKQEQLAPPVQDDSVAKFLHHQGPVYTVGVHPTQPQLCVSGDGEDTAIVWNNQTGEKVFELAGHTDTVIFAAFNHDGTLVATGSMDGTIKVWSATTGECARTLEGPSSELEWCQWHAKGNVIIGGAADHTLWCWNAATGDVMRVFSGHTGSVTCGQWSCDGKLIVTGSADQTVFVWSPKTGQPQHHMTGQQFSDAPVVCVSVHPRKPLALCGSADHTVTLIHMESGQSLMTYTGHADQLECVGFCRSPQLDVCATADIVGVIKIWDLTTNTCRVTMNHDEDTAVTKLLWHPTKPFLFSSGVDRTVRMWDARDGKCVSVWHGHRDVVLTMSLTCDHTRLVTGSDDSECHVYEVPQL